MNTTLFVEGLVNAYGAGLIIGAIVFVLFESLDYFNE